MRKVKNMSRAKNSTILVGTSTNFMHVIQNPEKLTAPKLQRRIANHMARLGAENVIKELCSSNWVEIYDKASRVNEIGQKGRRDAQPISLKSYSGPATRAILISGGSTLVLRRTNPGCWMKDKHTVLNLGIPAKAEDVPAPRIDTNANVVRLSKIVSADDTNLATAAIQSVVQLNLFPAVLDRDEHGNLVIETEQGRMLVSMAA